MATLACRVQFLDDTDPFNSTNFPEPSRPPLFTFREDLALGTQLAGVHRLLRAPHKVRRGGACWAPRWQPLPQDAPGWGRGGRPGLGSSPGHKCPRADVPPSPLGRGAPGTRRLARDLPAWLGGQPRAVAQCRGRPGLSRCRAGRRRDGEGSPAFRR